MTPFPLRSAWLSAAFGLAFRCSRLGFPLRSAWLSAALGLTFRCARLSAALGFPLCSALGRSFACCARSRHGTCQLTSFHLVLDDPSGNSFIEQSHTYANPSDDPSLHRTEYTRTATQDMAIGLQPSATARADGEISDINPAHKNKNNNSNATNIEETEDRADKLGRREVMSFPTDCPSCFKPSKTEVSES